MRIRAVIWFKDFEPVGGRDDEISERRFWPADSGPLSCLLGHYGFEALLPVHDLVLYVAALVLHAKPSYLLAWIFVEAPHRA